jgi:hypothetical protein
MCDGCNRSHPQTTTRLAPPKPGGADVWHLEYLCTPCYQFADYFDDIAPKGTAA